MTLGVRNTVIRTGAVLAVILSVTFGILAYKTFPASSVETLPGSWVHSWLVWSWSVGINEVVASLAAAGALGLIAVVGLIWASRIFRRVSSAEIYFIVLFLIALAVEQLRVVQLYLFTTRLPAVYGTILTRVVIAARIGGAFSLFVASLYAAGVDYPRIGSLTIGLGLLSFLFVYFVPVDTVAVSATMLHRIGGQSSLELTLLIAGVLTFINYIVAGIRGHRERGFLVAVAAVAMVAGGQMSQFLPSILWLAVGAALLLYGMLTFLLVTRDHFRWY